MRGEADGEPAEQIESHGWRRSGGMARTVGTLKSCPPPAKTLITCPVVYTYRGLNMPPAPPQAVTVSETQSNASWETVTEDLSVDETANMLEGAPPHADPAPRVGGAAGRGGPGFLLRLGQIWLSRLWMASFARGGKPMALILCCGQSFRGFDEQTGSESRARTHLSRVPTFAAFLLRTPLLFTFKRIDIIHIDAHDGGGWSLSSSHHKSLPAAPRREAAIINELHF